MTQHPIHTLPPAELRGYARGLRETAARLIPACGGLDASASSVLIATREAWEREAELVEGFAGRLEAAALNARPKAPSAAHSDFSSIFARMFEPPRPRATAQPAAAIQVCRDADAQCIAGCTVQRDGQCGRDKAAASAAAASDEAQQRAAGTYRETESTTTTIGAPDLAQEAQPSRGEGENAAATAPFAAAPAEEEKAQTGLADAVAESLAQPNAAEVTAQQMLAAVAEAKAAFLADHPELRASATRTTHSEASGARPWTAERLALLAQLFPTAIKMEDLRALLNELPGDPVNTDTSIRVKAAKIGHSRQGLPIPPQYQGARLSRTRVPQNAQPAHAAPEPEPPAKPPHHAQSRAENGAKPDTWTPERQGLLRRLYPSTMPVEEILAEVNLLPGPFVASMGAVEAQARKLGLSRKHPPRLDGAIAPEKGIEVPPMTTEDKAEAREMLRKGKLNGARDVMEFFGCTHTEALDLVDAHRGTQRSAA
jgi:hypothetical protein